ncbi:MAG TPA: ABC transporter permease subunit [Candidatus Limnocylindrales bacterium]|nr:ABC transporter permease subunit [Candidatus Limnocylindrales bacterium]
MILLSRGLSGLRTVNRRRVWAITRKELREYRRNRSVLVAIAIYPVVFLLQPMIAIFGSSAAAAGYLQHSNELLYLLGIPILVPATLAAHAITGERQQGSLEPVLTTPITREELIVGKALAALLPSIAIAYLVYVIFLVAVGVFAQPAISAAIYQSQTLIVQLVYTPLLAAATTWIGLAISTRTADARVAQQLSILGSLPLLLGAVVLAFDVVHATPTMFVVIGAVLVAIDTQGWRIVAPMFDRERLVTGTRS